jgi:hypothetical protein
VCSIYIMTRHHNLLLDYVNEARPVQQRVYDIFLMLRRFLEEHQIMFVGIAGTLLGAIMYHDFIPWDDDMDIAISADSMSYLRNLIDPNPSQFLSQVFGETRVRTQYLQTMGILQFLPQGGGSIDLIMYGTPGELNFIKHNEPILFKDVEILIPKNHMNFIITSYENVLHQAYVKNHRRFRGKPAPEFYMDWKKVNKLLNVRFTDEYRAKKHQ